MEQYEDDETTRARVLSNGQVLAFIGGYWRRRPWLFAGTVTLVLMAIGFELMVPRASQALVDAAVRGRRHASDAWRAWAFFVAVYLAFAVLNNTGMRFWILLAVRTMKEMTDEGFQRVQAFSADWHGDTFAGATVRRLSRAMWGYDVVSDAVVMWIGPALIIMFSLSVQMMMVWPAIGAISLVTVVSYIVYNLAIAN